MGRKLMPEGRRTVVGVRLSDQLTALVDEVRGELTRSAWVAAAVEYRLGMMARLPGQIPFVRFGETPPGSPEPLPPDAVQDAARRIRVIPDERMPEGTVALVSGDSAAVLTGVGGKPARKPRKPRRPEAAAPVAAELARERSADRREAEEPPPAFPCCRHCHHGGAKGHGYACTKC